MYQTYKDFIKCFKPPTNTYFMYFAKWYEIPIVPFEYLNYWIENILSELKTFIFWFSPPWNSFKKCPACAGEKGKYKYDTYFECDFCNGTGKVKK